MNEKGLKKVRKYSEKMYLAEKDTSFQVGLSHMLDDQYFKYKKKLRKTLEALDFNDLKEVYTLALIGEDLDYGLEHPLSFDAVFEGIMLNQSDIIHKLTHKLKLHAYIELALEETKKNTQN